MLHSSSPNTPKVPVSTFNVTDNNESKSLGLSSLSTHHPRVISVAHRGQDTMASVIDHTARDLQHSTNIPLQASNSMNEHAVTETRVKSGAELFKENAEIQKKQLEGGVEIAETEMKKYEKDLFVLKVQTVALCVLFVTVMVGIFCASVAVAILCPPLVGVGTAAAAGIIVAASAGMVTSAGAGYFAIHATSFGLMDYETRTRPEDQRKQLINLNTAMKLMDEYPQYMKFLDSVPALTKDGVRLYELDNLNLYNNSFIATLNLTKYDEAIKIIADLRSVEGQLKTLRVEEPFDESSIQKRLEKLPKDEETSNLIIDLATRLSQLRTKSDEAEKLVSGHKRSDLENRRKAHKKILVETIKEKQLQSELE